MWQLRQLLSSFICTHTHTRTHKKTHTHAQTSVCSATHPSFSSLLIKILFHDQVSNPTVCVCVRVRARTCLISDWLACQFVPLLDSLPLPIPTASTASTNLKEAQQPRLGRMNSQRSARHSTSRRTNSTTGRCFSAPSFINNQWRSLHPYRATTTIRAEGKWFKN